jgi:hypothetical protein
MGMTASPLLSLYSLPSQNAGGNIGKYAVAVEERCGQVESIYDASFCGLTIIIYRVIFNSVYQCQEMSYAMGTDVKTDYLTHRI